MKIDVKQIEGYAEMTAEQKVLALEAYELDNVAPAQGANEDVTKLKTALSRANSEAAEYKRQLREKQTEQERAEAERAEANKKLQDELNALRRDKTISGYAGKLVANGFDAETAAKMAASLPDGVSDDFFTSQKAFLDSTKQAIEAAALNKQPGLTGGATPQGKEIVDPMVAAFMKAAMGN